MSEAAALDLVLTEIRTGMEQAEERLVEMETRIDALERWQRASAQTSPPKPVVRRLQLASRAAG